MSGDPRPDLSATIAPLVEGGLDCSAALGAITNLGYRGVQWPATQPTLRPRDFDAGALRGLKSELKRLELTCSGLDVWIPPGHFLDPALLDRAVAALDAAIAFAAGVAEVTGDRPVVCTLFPSKAERKNSGRSGEALDEAVTALAALAEREGIAIADHAVDPAAGIGFGVDPAACLASGVDPVARVLAAGNDLCSARLVDLFRSGLRGPVGESGESRLDVSAYRATLDIVGFRRAVVVDARQWREPLSGLTKSLERWAGGPVARRSDTPRTRSI